MTQCKQIALGSGGAFADDCFQGGYIGVDFDIHRDLSEDCKLYTDWKECKIYNLDSSKDENAIFRFIEQNKSDISYYLSHSDKVAESGNTIAAQFIVAFKNNSFILEKIKDIYLGSLLTSYLSFQPQNVQMGVEFGYKFFSQFVRSKHRGIHKNLQYADRGRTTTMV